MILGEGEEGVGGGGGVDLIKLTYFFYLFGNKGLSKLVDPDQTLQKASSNHTVYHSSSNFTHTHK